MIVARKDKNKKNQKPEFEYTSKGRDVYEYQKQRDIKQQKRPTKTIYYVWTVVILIAMCALSFIAISIIKHFVSNFMAQRFLDGDNSFGTILSEGFGSTGVIIASVVVGILSALFGYWRMMLHFNAVNAMYDDSMFTPNEDDVVIRSHEDIIESFHVVPDAGFHYSTAGSSTISHIMASNKGLPKVEVAMREIEDGYDENGDRVYKGEIIRDEDGDAVFESKPVFDMEFQKELFTASEIPQEAKRYRTPFDIAYMPYNPKNSAGVRINRDKLDYDTIGDLIKDDWEFPEYEVQRPAGVYIVDTAPVNTMVLAITRAGKGQTYIETTIDMWTREKRPNNIVINDPKGELIVKFYVPASVRGYEIVQFNLINSMKTDIYNPLGFAAEAAREGDFTKAASYVENIGDIFFPKEGADDPMWPNAANNAFKRSCYVLIDIYLEEEKALRRKASRTGMSQKVLEQQLDDMWGKVTLYNAYQLFVILTSKKSDKFMEICLDNKQVKEYEALLEEHKAALGKLEALGAAITDDMKEPPKPPKITKEALPLLDILCDATKQLPKNSMRTLVSNTDNALRAMAGSEKTMASVYGIALTAMSFFTDPTISTLTSGKPSQNFDAGGLSFPRRIGVRFSPEYQDRYKTIGLQAVWTAYRDAQFSEKYEGKDFTHSELISREGWARYFFDGKFDKRKNYLKLELIDPSTKSLVKTFYFLLTLGYKTTLDGKNYVKDPVLGDKIVHNGVLEELQKTEDGKFVVKESYIKIKRDDGFYKEVSTSEHAMVPVISQTLVRYSEKPKMVFFITPPHLMNYAKLILILIKQMIDVNFEGAYMTKPNQKPLYKTRYMLDELGNLQSEGHGIPGLQTMLSIGLGQDQQFTLILQTLQQLRDVYGESVDKIIQGNAQPLTANVLTPDGFRPMGEIKVGDRVLTPSGRNVEVLGVYPKGVRPVYKITLRDGSTTEACGEHLWEVSRFKSSIKYTGEIDDLGRRVYEGLSDGKTCTHLCEILSTTELKEKIDKGLKFDVPRIQPVPYSEKLLDIDPYVLGVILSSQFRIEDDDIILKIPSEEIANRIRSIGYRLYAYKDAAETPNMYRLPGFAETFNEVLWGVVDYRRVYIPSEYMVGSVSQRTELLRGLMDMKGTISIKSEMKYSTTSELLADDMASLIRSLGGRVDVVKDDILKSVKTSFDEKDLGYTYTVKNMRLPDIKPFTIKSKLDRWKNRSHSFGTRIVSVEYVRDDEVQCIKVDDDRHLYVTDDYIPTHNTSNIIYLKSTDDEMIKTLESLSGTTHRLVVESSTVTTDVTRQFAKNEGAQSNTRTLKEVPTISFNDMLFIPKNNSIVFRAGDPPIWNRNQTVLPMSWRLLKDTITVPGEEYSLQTIPTLSSAMNFDIRKNQPNFYTIFDKRVKQARLAPELLEQYKTFHNYTDHDMDALNPDILSDEIMTAIQYLLEEAGEATTLDSMDKEDVQKIEKALEASSQDNEELEAEASQAQREQDENNVKRFANGQISRRMLNNNGRPSGSFDTIIAEAYSLTRQYFAADRRFIQEADGSLRDAKTNTLYIEATKGYNEDVRELINENLKSEKSRVFAEDYIEEEDMGPMYKVMPDFVIFLSNQSSWDNIAAGEFNREVARLFSSK